MKRIGLYIVLALFSASPTVLLRPGNVLAAESPDVISRFKDRNGDIDYARLAKYFKSVRADIELSKQLFRNMGMKHFFRLMAASDAELLREITDREGIDIFISFLDDASYRDDAEVILVKIGEPAVEPLIKKFSESSGAYYPVYSDASSFRLYVVRTVGEIADRRAIRFLADRLDDDNEAVRLDAAKALNRISGSASAEYLAGALAAGKADLRGQAAESLVKIGKPAIASLVNLLSNPDPGVRLAAVKALGEIGDGRAVEFLTRELDDREDNIYLEAAVALIKTGRPAVSRLVTLLGDQKILVRTLSQKALSVIGEPAVAPLISVLGDENPVVRKLAAESLGRIADPRAKEPVSKLLEDKDALVRKAAREALGRITGPLQTRTTMDMMRGAGRAISSGFTAQEKTESPDTRTLIEMLKDPDVNNRWQAAEALGKLREPKAVEALIERLTDKYLLVREESARSLTRIGEPSIGPLIEALKDSDTRSYALRALAEIGEPAVPRLVSALGSGDRDAVTAVIETLGLTGSAASVEPLAGLMGDPELMRPALQALLRIGRPSARALVEIVRTGPAASRDAAADALVRLGGAETVKMLKSALEGEKNGDASRALANALNTIEEKERLAASINRQFGIAVEQNPETVFTVKQLELVHAVLSAMPRELLDGLSTIKSCGPGYSYSGTYVDYVIELNTSRPLYPRTLFHEIGHFIDSKYFCWTAFGRLYAESSSNRDFADAEARTNALEDFAVTFARYTDDTRGEFARAIAQARKGDPVYLKKLIFVLMVFTNGGSGRTLAFETGGSGNIAVKEIKVARDKNGDIASLDGVKFYDKNGALNLDGLKDLFKRLSFGG